MRSAVKPQYCLVLYSNSVVNDLRAACPGLFHRHCLLMLGLTFKMCENKKGCPSGGQPLALTASIGCCFGIENQIYDTACFNNAARKLKIFLSINFESLINQLTLRYEIDRGETAVCGSLGKFWQ